MIKVAVYGTLRQGFHNNYLLENSLFLGKATGNFPAVMFSAGGFPKLDLTKDHDYPPLVAELYEVSASVLRCNLDALEGYPGWYDRTQMEFTLDSGEVVTAWVYHQVVDDGRAEVESSDWAEFTKINRRYG